MLLCPQHNASYVAAQAAFVTQQLTTAPSTYNFVVSHYPIFGARLCLELMLLTFPRFSGGLDSWRKPPSSKGS